MAQVGETEAEEGGAGGDVGDAVGGRGGFVPVGVGSGAVVVEADGDACALTDISCALSNCANVLRWL